MPLVKKTRHAKRVPMTAVNVSNPHPHVVTGHVEVERPAKHVPMTAVSVTEPNTHVEMECVELGKPAKHVPMTAVHAQECVAMASSRWAKSAMEGLTAIETVLGLWLVCPCPVVTFG